MSSIKRKKISGYINLCIPAQKATPAPPVGPAFGQKGLSGMDFCKQFNEVTKKLEPMTPTRVLITAYVDRTFTFVLKGTPVSHLLKKFAKLEKGSSEPGRSSIGTISQADITSVAEIKMKEGLSARCIESAIKTIEGSARSMGLKILKDSNND